jgi:hypothetical protein
MDGVLREGVIMKNKCIVLMMILLSLVIISPSVLAVDKDKCSEWNGPIKGVSYRYCRLYLGEDQWSPFPNYVQFWNANLYKVKITFYETIAGKKDQYGPYVHFLDPSNDKNPGIKVALPKDALVSSITAEPSQ